MTANREIPAEVPASRADGGRPFAAKRRGVGARSRDVEVLLGVAQRISGTESLDEILEALVGMTSLAISCERCSFFLNDPGTDELYTRVAQGIRRQETVRLLNNEGIAGAAFLTGQSIIVDDAYADPRFNAAIDRGTGYVTKTVLCVPIRTGKGEVIGVAQALNKVGGLFSKNDQTLLEGIAAQSVPALQSSQTVERMRKARAQELAFLDIVADITSQIDLDQLLQRVMTEANRMLGAERSTLFLHDDKTNELFSRVAMGPKIGEIRFPDSRRYRRRRVHHRQDGQYSARLCGFALQPEL